MRLVTLVALLSPLVACYNNKEHVHRDGPIGPSWWKPAPGETNNWDIQVHAPFDLGTERAMFVVDLWAAVPAATTIDYGDGDPVDVPAGALPTAIGTLQARQTVIVCRVGMGGIRLSDPDARKFPGFSATVPNRPDSPDPGSVIGWGTTQTEQDERYLDLAQRDAWEDLAFARVDLAKQIGCDAIEPYLSDIGTNETGFTALTLDMQRSWYAAVALAVHDRELSVGMRNGTNIGLVDSLAASFDWLLVERCGEFDECDLVRPFLNARKAVFAIDFTTDIDGNPLTTSVLCSKQVDDGMIEDGLVKDAALSSTFRQQCVP